MRTVKHFQMPLWQCGTLLVASHDRDQCQRCFLTWQPAGEFDRVLVPPLPLPDASGCSALPSMSHLGQSSLLSAPLKTWWRLHDFFYLVSHRGWTPVQRATTEAGQWVSVMAAAPEALESSVWTRGSVTVCHEKQWVAKDRQTTARGETVGAAPL